MTAAVIIATGCAGQAARHASAAGARPARAHPIVAAAAGAARHAHNLPAGHTSGASHRDSRATSRVTAVPGPPAPGYTGSHFATPQAAMRYLTAAYNSHNARALHAVTDRGAFAALSAMRSEAVNLRLVSCVPRRRGDFMCHFKHDYPASLHKSGHGASEFVVAPARNPGWYMYFLLECG